MSKEILAKETMREDGELMDEQMEAVVGGGMLPDYLIIAFRIINVDVKSDTTIDQIKYYI